MTKRHRLPALVIVGVLAVVTAAVATAGSSDMFRRFVSHDGRARSLASRSRTPRQWPRFARFRSRSRRRRPASSR